MSLFIFLTVVQAIIAAALVGVILMQKSEGGGLGVGGNPNGMMSARGAADFLTRATKWLAVAFVVLSIVLAIIAVETGDVGEITTTLDRNTPAASPDPLGAPAEANGAADAKPAAVDSAAPSPAPSDPLSGAAE